MRRVVVTGMGIVSPLGLGVNHVWSNLKNSKSGLANIKSFVVDPSFNVNKIPSNVAGLIPTGSYADNCFNIDEWMDSKEARRVDMFIQYAMAAAKQAMKDAGLENLTEEQKLTAGVNLGSGIGGLQRIYENSTALHEDAYKRITPFFVPGALINLASGLVAIEYGLKGHNSAVVTACASGSHSIGDAMRLIQMGDADIMVSGGAEAPVNPIGVAGFARMNALSTNFNNNPTQASRPWDKDRDGFVIAEGAGVLVLEELEHAKARGANIYAEVVGYASTGDAYHITAPSGEGAKRCMVNAVKSAKINLEDINYINAHGTSTPAGDVAELNSVKELFGNSGKQVYMSSTKSATGHLLGAAGAVEAIFCIKAINEGVLPPTLNLHNSEDAGNIDLIPHTAKEAKLDYVLSNSFGFGGTNASLVLKKI